MPGLAITPHSASRIYPTCEIAKTPSPIDRNCENAQTQRPLYLTCANAAGRRSDLRCYRRCQYRGIARPRVKCFQAARTPHGASRIYPTCEKARKPTRARPTGARDNSRAGSARPARQAASKATRPRNPPAGRHAPASIRRANRPADWRHRAPTVRLWAGERRRDAC